MTENERMSISGLLDILDTGISFSTCHIEYAIQSDVLEDLACCLEELEQYRAIGTVEHIKLTFELCKGLDAMVKMYEAIGTIEELQELKEKSVAKKPIVDGCLTLCPICRASVDWKNYCDECGQKIDWQ